MNKVKIILEYNGKSKELELDYTDGFSKDMKKFYNLDAEKELILLGLNEMKEEILRKWK